MAPRGVQVVGRVGRSGQEGYRAGTRHPVVIV